MIIGAFGEYFRWTFVLMAIKPTRAKEYQGGFAKHGKIYHLTHIVTINFFGWDAVIRADSGRVCTLHINNLVHPAGYQPISLKGSPSEKTSFDAFIKV